MAVAVTSASQRDALRTRRSIVRFAEGDVLLAAASGVVILLLVLTCAGRFAAASFAPATGPIVNLNHVANAAALEPALAGVFDDAERTRVAGELFGFLVSGDASRRDLRSVRSIGTIRTGEARLLTSAQVTALKPRFVVRGRTAFLGSLLLWGALYLAAFHAVSFFWRWKQMPGDRLLLAAAHLLTGIGLAVIVSMPDPVRDEMLFIRYATTVVVGLGIAAAVSTMNVRTSWLRDLSYLPLIGVALLAIALAIFGRGPGGSDAKVNLGPVQPVEGMRILLALFLAGYFARHWELLRDVRGRAPERLRLPEWIHVPRAAYVLPILGGVVIALVLFAALKDLGPALTLSIIFLAAYAIVRGRLVMALAGCGLLAIGFYAGYRLNISTTLANRVRMWQSPWDNAASGGIQVAEALWSLATGGTFGAGPGLGDTRYIPAGHTDLVLAAIGEEFGFIGVLACLVLFAAIVWRALSTARRATSEYGFFLAVLIGLSFAVPVILMCAGTLGLLPLTGVVTPFLSYGGSAMLGNFALLGLLAALRSDVGHAPADTRAFSRGLQVLGGALALVFVVIVGTFAKVQVLSADELVVRPHLGTQADGGRRYQYNQRVLDVARRIPRGSILDRAGRPLSSDDRALLDKGAAAWQPHGVNLQRQCPQADERCYPLGARAFHVLGNADARLNWTAGNSSYVERDYEARLRGFDDRQTIVKVSGTGGVETSALRRDYSELVPLLRHRYQPNHDDVKRIMARPRNVRLTIDGALQLRVAAILADAAERHGAGRAAAVVIDPATGDLLASVSYPWPSEETLARWNPTDEDSRAELLDRARYGQYPPGSTFKLVTAAAALTKSAGLREETFLCSRLPDGRVGVKLKGWDRPIRDDVLDKDPHGAVNLHRGIVVSCNAYFAQLAMRVGAPALLDIARRAELSVSRGNDAERLRSTLPQAGYGQGEVVATPLQVARVTAAIAADGLWRTTRLLADGDAAEEKPLVSSQAARILATSMRDVVLEGTARSLRDVPIAIAGKTGTAEVSPNTPSHAWFTGFAPSGPATRRVAVAVILENAGYGGRSAAPVAGDIIKAAQALGLVK
jgi:cell division protein FtsW (lipid II flippase)